MFTVRLAGNGHYYQGNGFAVAVLALAMPLDHPNFAANVPYCAVVLKASKKPS